MAVTVPANPTYESDSGTSLAMVRTVSDALAHLRDWTGVATDANIQRMAYRAIRDGLESLSSQHPWSYYTRRYRFSTEASYSTGTVAYTHSTLSLTLTTGTWPDWAGRGTVIIDDVHYPVQSRTSSSVVVLDPNVNPGDDVASGTSYELYLDVYQLPRDFVSLATTIREMQRLLFLDYVPVDEFQSYRANNLSPGTPYICTVMRDRAFAGDDAVDAVMHDMAVYLRPPPSTARTYDVIYKIRPRDFTVPGGLYQTGTVTTSSTTVTGTGTNWNSRNMLGAVIRFGTVSNLPEGRESPNKYVEQRFVTGVSSTTSLTIDSALTSNLTGVKYEISDPLDVEPGAMYRAFLRRIEYEMALTRHRDDPRGVDAAERRWIGACREAMAADSRGAPVESPRIRDFLGTISFPA